MVADPRKVLCPRAGVISLPSPEGKRTRGPGGDSAVWPEIERTGEDVWSGGLDPGQGMGAGQWRSQTGLGPQPAAVTRAQRPPDMRFCANWQCGAVTSQ